MTPERSSHAHWGDRFFSSVISPVVGLVGFMALFLLRRTIRFRLVGFEDLFERTRKGERVVVALWRNQVLLMPFLWKGKRRKGHAIVSRSRNGEISSSLLRYFGIAAIRGDLAHDGVTGRGQLPGLARSEGESFFIAADGPPGPAFRVKEGVALLATDPTVPVYCVAVSFSRFWMLGRWDGLLVPYPFCRAFFVSSPPVFPGQEQDAGKRLERLQHSINRVNERSRALSLGRI
ncbi:MAG: lysophospholipid acyltransferase family protein [Leptospirales bacterium]